MLRERPNLKYPVEQDKLFLSRWVHICPTSLGFFAGGARLERLGRCCHSRVHKQPINSTDAPQGIHMTRSFAIPGGAEFQNPVHDSRCPSCNTPPQRLNWATGGEWLQKWNGLKSFHKLWQRSPVHDYLCSTHSKGLAVSIEEPGIFWWVEMLEQRKD